PRAARRLRRRRRAPVALSPRGHRVTHVGSGMRARRTTTMLALAVVTVVVALSATACSDSGSDDSSASVRVFHEGDSIMVKDGQEFVIALTANPSTGYT